jgi:SAM-dependent methyltransferase
MTARPETATDQRDALADRLFEATIAGFDMIGVYLGERLGYYRTLAALGPTTSQGLAEATGTDERYAREWLEQQAVTGVLDVDLPSAGGDRRYSLPRGHAEVLLDRDSPAHVGPLARGLVAVTLRVPDLVEAYRTGRGVDWEAYGPDMRSAQADLNRPLFMGPLGTVHLPAIPDVHARLQSDPPVRVADVACGEGWSSIGMARAYPKVTVHGLDLDAPAIEAARANAEAAGVADRVRFEVRDAADPLLEGRFDLVTAFECIHDMSRPVQALEAMRRLVSDDGTVLVLDERVADEFTAPGDDVERFMYGWSITCCLPCGLADRPSAGTGTVMRASTLGRYAEEAGYSAVEILPIEHDTMRYYRLRP